MHVQLESWLQRMACDPGIIVSVFVYLSCTQQKDDDDSAFRTAEFPFVESVELLGTCYRDRTFYYSRADYCCCGRQLRLLVQYFAFYLPLSLSLFFRGDLYFSMRVDLFEKRVKKIKGLVFLKYQWLGCFLIIFGQLEIFIFFAFSSSIILRENNGKSTSFFFSFRGDLYFSVRVDFLKGVDVISWNRKRIVRFVSLIWRK